MDEPPTNSKYLLLVPTTFNDGSQVPEDVFIDLQDSLFLRFNGYTVGGTVSGAYRMANGKKAVDHLVQDWIVIQENQEKELRQIVIDLAKKLGQESMFLEKTGSTVDFVTPVDLSGEQS